jgi:stalled ribosome alternative rescue factor ArfA
MNRKNFFEKKKNGMISFRRKKSKNEKILFKNLKKFINLKKKLFST